MDYNDNDIVAIVKGEKITISELRFLYPDENVLEMTEGKAELVIQEAKQMNLDVPEQIKETVKVMGILPPKDVDTSWADSNRVFAESQAQLGMVL